MCNEFNSPSLAVTNSGNVSLISYYCVFFGYFFGDSLRAKKKKKKDSGGVSSASKAVHSGYLYQKGMLSWTQRYCSLSSDHRLLCYRSERDSKPLLCLPLSGRDVVYTLRTDSRFNHALRVSMPGTETHWFFTDTKDLADLWLMVCT